MFFDFARRAFRDVGRLFLPLLQQVSGGMRKRYGRFSDGGLGAGPGGLGDGHHILQRA
jgi:hypothetical protein